MLVLGIETSCDETAAAVVRDGRTILSSIISSQIRLHRPYGGVVPELASREHLEKIEQVVSTALSEASISLEEVDAIAVTQGPGLVGALLVGVSYAKALSFGLNIPLIGVNHIEGHVFSVVFDNPKIVFPTLALIVSGGHTNIFFVPESGRYRLVSRTRDDAAGEAFDKVAKMLGLGYPGGPIIERIAQDGDAKAVRFTKAKISDGRPDLSFSGLKTAVAKYMKENAIDPVGGGHATQELCDLAASFQASVVDALVSTLERLALELTPRSLIVAGGVACNLKLQDESRKMADSLGIPVYFPSKHLSTDNAAMIAAAGYFHLSSGRVSDENITADVTLRLQNDGITEPTGAGKRPRYRV
ncbi:tRNA (adenosine(37)-N6)-threonylcarbamoyltransferase complex transferase subunit TsaD [Leptolyngbya sp. 7M]|uniref:tRNA (adenosine(37)-N6)-threonylcarbamoyltransferase complex transferase subunit TsaD n=1 Tax=Leptolyngbya sp. 7M TaxID=2812896 RepID=UPI001B8CA6BA|nr:tRNA (adenosine(37)-N6)-threonylcarbamoyltransferase complex transferase subunit TsaD [Leptolyngbya sp. 7M]QYO66889.1 tRNA (adenosine(37)-N6)-threonylcarbamoyltransferase complex transferase subunit TsaD [Leptolyngbya sp. 7M]